MAVSKLSQPYNQTRFILYITLRDITTNKSIQLCINKK